MGIGDSGRAGHNGPLKPLAIELFAGLSGWGEGFAAEGYRVVGFDLYDMPKKLGLPRPNGDIRLVLQDVLTIHGKQFKDAAVIVASPPCQAYSYRAMPWKLGKAQKPPEPIPDWWLLPESQMDAAQFNAWSAWKEFHPADPPSNALFNACFRIQREACEAAGHHIPMVVENVKGAQPWVGPAKAHFGSFYLWGDVGMVGNRVVAGGLSVGGFCAPMGGRKRNPDGTEHGTGSWFAVADSKNRGASEGSKNNGGSWFAIGSPGQENVGQNPDGRKVPDVKRGEEYRLTQSDGRKVPGINLSDVGFNVAAAQRYRDERETFGWSKDSPIRQGNSKSDSRKAASAQIAKIPFALSSYIARAFRP